MFQVVPPQRSSASASKGTVLVVDDELTVVRVYARALGAEGFRVLTATDGETAEVMFRRCRLDAVISDVSMPGTDGLTLLHALHAIDPDVPVILATGEQGGELAQRAVEEGALAFLVKPIDLRALAQITAHAIQLRRAAARADGARTEAPRAGAGFEAWLEGLWIAYQPIVGWASLAVLGYEAFVRSDDPSAAEPCDLFAAAGEPGHARELGRAIRARIAAGIEDAPAEALVFVNLHAVELADEALYDAREPLRAHAARVVLEVTERAALSSVPDLIERIRRLRAAGFRIAVDDLGAGYAGLSTFAQLEPTMVKLDASLTRDVHRSPVKRRIVQAVSSLCQDVGVELIAEGVESEEERQALGFLGCRYQQGCAYGRPSRSFGWAPGDGARPGESGA